jgi:hypothetical protein
VKPVHAIVGLLVIVAVVLVVLLSGWADDKAKPGTSGRGTVPAETVR